MVRGKGLQHGPGHRWGRRLSLISRCPGGDYLWSSRLDSVQGLVFLVVLFFPSLTAADMADDQAESRLCVGVLAKYLIMSAVPSFYSQVPY